RAEAQPALRLRQTNARKAVVAKRGSSLKKESDRSWCEATYQAGLCREYAGDARRKADAAVDLGSKAGFLDMEKRWMTLARCYASMKSLGDEAGADDSLRLQEISTLLIQEGNLSVLYDRVLEAAIGLMSSDMGSIQTFHPERDELRLLA